MSLTLQLNGRDEKTKAVNPPKLAERLLQLVLPAQVRDNVCGDLSEMFCSVIVPGCGISGARRWYWLQVACSIRLFFRFRKNPQAALELWAGRRNMYKPTHNVIAFHPGISMHHIPIGSGIPGILFVLGTLFIFGVGIPGFLVLLGISGIVGLLTSRIIFIWHKRHALKIQTLNLHKLEQ